MEEKKKKESLALNIYAYVMLTLILSPFIGCAALFGWTFVGAMLGNYDVHRSDVGAIVIAEKAVRNQCLSPSSAKFPCTTASEEINGKRLIKGTVEASNAFGVKMKNTFTCVVKYNDTKHEYEVTDIEIK